MRRPPRSGVGQVVPWIGISRRARRFRRTFGADRAHGSGANPGVNNQQPGMSSSSSSGGTVRRPLLVFGSSDLPPAPRYAVKKEER